MNSAAPDSSKVLNPSVASSAGLQKQTLRCFLRRTSLGFSPVEWAVLLCYSAIALVTVAYHEPWADEAQAWLIARDLPLSKLWLQTRYEGTPPLWHLVLWVLTRCHLSYAHIGLASATISIAAAFIWLRYSPLPLALKSAALFTFYMQYQHAVVARSYCLTMLLAFAVVALWRRRPDNILSVAILVSLLAQTNAYGFVLAGTLTFVIAFEQFQRWRTNWPRRAERIQCWAALILIELAACLAVFLTNAPPDLSFVGTVSFDKVPVAALQDAIMARLTQSLEAAFGSEYIGLAVILGVIALCAEAKRRVQLLPFASILLMLLCMLYKGWHLGMPFVALLVTLWLAWPSEDKCRRLVTGMVSCALALLFCVHMAWAFRSVRADIQGPYTGAAATAEYLKTKVDQRTIYGINYRTVGVLPYFHRNIFINQPDHSYWAWSVSNDSDIMMWNMPLEPHSIIVWATPYRELVAKDYLRHRLEKNNFRLTHRFCGELFWREYPMQDSCYWIYEN